MDSNRTFSKEEISKILDKASKIQSRKDLNRDEIALSVDDLQHIANEVGIDHESLHEAIRSAGITELDVKFNWFKLSSTILEDKTVEGELTDDAWEDVVQDIRRITGYIGKPVKMGKMYEWVQPESDTGVEKQLSMSPQQGSTKIRFIAQWKAFEIILVGFSMFVGTGLGMFLFNLLGFSGATFFTLPILGGFAGFGLSRLYMKHYFEKQKRQYKQIVATIEKRLDRSNATKALLDVVEGDQNVALGNKQNRRERS